MKFKFSTIILLLMVFAPFDLLVLKFLPLPEKVYGFARFGVEFSIYGIFFFLILRNMVFGKLLTRTPIDIPLVLFFAVSILSIIVNRVPIGPALVGWRDLWRFVVLFYILTNINLDERFHRKVITMFVVIGCMQGAIALYQHFAGIDKFFLPRATTVEIAGKVTNYKLLAENNKTYEKGSGVGTICDAVQLANYLLICLAVVVPLFLHYSRITLYKRMFNLIAFGLILVGIFMSYSRISTLFALLSIFITFIAARELKRLFPIAITGALIIIITLAVVAVVPSNKSSTYYNPRLKETSPIENFTQIFSSSLAEKSFETSRGYVIANALPALIKSLNLIGYGPDVDNSLYKLVQKI
ncbi:MAG: O-antigen ligase family protein [Bacteroidetes bacterium]|nr:O-antigen ligase family protein [Bacteroidota bacterium]